MDNQTLEQLLVAVRIIPRLTQCQYTGIMGVLKAYYGHAGRPGLVGGSMPRLGAGNGGTVLALAGSSNGKSNPPDALIAAMGHKQWAGVVHKTYLKHGQISSELLAKEAAAQGKKETRVEEWDKVMQKALKSDLYSGNGEHSPSTVYKLKSDKAVAKSKGDVNKSVPSADNKKTVDKLIEIDKFYQKKINDINSMLERVDKEFKEKQAKEGRDPKNLTEYTKFLTPELKKYDMTTDTLFGFENKLKEQALLDKLDVLRSNNPIQKGILEIHGKPIPASNRKSITDLYEKTIQAFHADYFKNGIPELNIWNVKQRGSYNPTSKTILAELTSNDKAITIIHEVAHHLEHQSSIKKTAHDFLMSRTNNGKMPKTRYRNSPDEECWVDKFLDMYMGKDYKNGSSEIVSMGIETLLTNPKKFSAGDPEYTNFILDLMSGGKQKKKR